MSTQTSFVTPAPPAQGLRADGGPRYFPAAAPRGERPCARGRFAEGSADRARAVRFIIIALAVTFLTVFVVLPLVVVFASAFSKGISAYFAALAEPEALSAIKLTLAGGGDLRHASIWCSA